MPRTTFSQKVEHLVSGQEMMSWSLIPSKINYLNFFPNLQYQSVFIVRLSTDFTEGHAKQFSFTTQNVNEFDREWYDHAKCDMINSGGGDHCISAWKIVSIGLWHTSIWKWYKFVFKLRVIV